jgi:raffinose synthase
LQPLQARSWVYRIVCQHSSSLLSSNVIIIYIEAYFYMYTANGAAGVLLMACSTDPFHLVDAGVAAAAALSGGAAPRAAKQLPASLDGFGW